tara:strand:+ start:33 stop:413 length:381 start_codon:yes stop_codon:yes gene_type:complete
MYIPLPTIGKKVQSLHTYNKLSIISNEVLVKRRQWLKKNIIKKKNYNNVISCNLFAEKLYQKGYNGIDIIDLIENENSIKNDNKYLYLIYFDKIRSEYRNEKLFIFVILNLFFMRKNLNLENILEM